MPVTRPTEQQPAVSSVVSEASAEAHPWDGRHLNGQFFEGIYPTPKVIEVRGFSRARRYGVYAESAYIFCTGRVVAQRMRRVGRQNEAPKLMMDSTQWLARMERIRSLGLGAPAPSPPIHHKKFNSPRLAFSPALLPMFVYYFLLHFDAVS